MRKSLHLPEIMGVDLVLREVNDFVDDFHLILDDLIFALKGFLQILHEIAILVLASDILLHPPWRW